MSVVHPTVNETRDLNTRETFQATCDGLPRVQENSSIAVPQSAGHAQAIRIIKLGGSLLDIPQLNSRLIDIVSQWSPMRNILVVGGGPAADLIRVWDRHLQLGDHRAHQLAVWAMDWNARHFLTDDSNFYVVPDPAAQIRKDKVGIVSALRFLNALHAGKPATPLPESWEVTSDSIAAYIGQVLQAHEIVLLKSVSCQTHSRFTADEEVNRCSADVSGRHVSPQVHDISDRGRLQSLAKRQLVDVCFPEFARAIPRILWCNFRAEQ